MRVIFTHERQRRARETREIAEELRSRRPRGDQPSYTTASPPSRASRPHYGCRNLGAELTRRTGTWGSICRQSVIAITTSLPEIGVSLAAVRIGALDLGIGNVLGSNLFNLLILGLDDVFYRQGPLMADARCSWSLGWCWLPNDGAWAAFGTLVGTLDPMPMCAFRPHIVLRG